MKTTTAERNRQKYQQVREIWDVTTYGISPSKLLAGADKDGYVPGALPPNPRHIRLVAEFLRECCRQTKTIRRNVDSYGLRAYIRSWYADKFGSADDFYVSNGAVIAAALAEGYRVIRTRPEAPNAFFDMALTRKR